MKIPRLILALALFPALVSFAGNKGDEYQVGTFLSASAVADGTITSTLHGDGTTVAGGVYSNQVGLYSIKVPGGIWSVETKRQAEDSWMRNMGWTPTHFTSEKQNPLDFMKNGDKVIFRVEKHKKLVGSETDVYVPFADKPDKEVTFVGTFKPDTVQAPAVPSSSSNVKAVCDSGRLSPEVYKQICDADRLTK